MRTFKYDLFIDVGLICVTFTVFAADPNQQDIEVLEQQTNQGDLGAHCNLGLIYKSVQQGLSNNDIKAFELYS